MYQVVRHLCINLAIPTSDRIVVGRVLKQFLRGGLELLGSKPALDTAVHDAFLERKVESAESPQHLFDNVVVHFGRPRDNKLPSL